MANFFNKFKQKNIDKKIVPVILAIDASGSMNGKRITHLNNAIRNIMKSFVAYNGNEENDFFIRMAILKFSSGSQWITSGLVDPADLNFSGISCGGVTDLGSALNELDQKLSRQEFFIATNSYAAPFICLVTDGMPTDDYGVSLKKLNGNKWYKVAKKVAVAIGDTVDFHVLHEVVGSSDAIVHLNTEALLEQVMVGLCTTLFPSVVSVATVIPPVRPMTTAELDSDQTYYSRMARESAEFDSDQLRCSRIALESAEFDLGQICCSRIAHEPAEFDSDSFGETCVLGPPNNHDDTWDDSDWDGSGLDDADWGISPQSSSANVHVCYQNAPEPLHNMNAFDCPIPQDIHSHSHITSPMSQVSDDILAGSRVFCSYCGSVVIAGQKFCSECGTPVMQLSPPKVNVHQVQFSAIVPKQFTKGDYAMIDISVYEEMYRNIVDRIIANADDEVKEVIGSSQEIIDHTLIRISLSSPDLELIDCDETQKWQGKYLTFSFPVAIPNNYAKKQILFIANVYFNDVIATRLKFIANCSSAKEQKIRLTREDVLTAFISYASQDRSRVATIIQGMQKARPDMDIFFDVENLRSGDNWESTLRREIEQRDILFLCWSNYARASEWVEKEWRYALLHKGIDSIEPIPLVSPVECPPPEELKSKHFNDRALLYREV